MKKSTSFLPFIAVLFSLMVITSCFSGKEQDNMNESIQTIFFDTSFGATKEEVISNFKKHGFALVSFVSNDNILRFSPINGMYFSFGNMSWEDMRVSLNNNKFCAIEFYNAYKEKFSAESDYNSILSALKAKYKMAEEELSDTLTYKIQRGIDGKGHVVIVYYQKAESFNNEIWFYSCLLYSDTNIEDEPSDEL